MLAGSGAHRRMSVESMTSWAWAGSGVHRRLYVHTGISDMGFGIGSRVSAGPSQVEILWVALCLSLTKKLQNNVADVLEST